MGNGERADEQVQEFDERSYVVIRGPISRLSAENGSSPARTITFGPGRSCSWATLRPSSAGAACRGRTYTIAGALAGNDVVLAMTFLPGSHCHGIVPHCSAQACNPIGGALEASVDSRAAEQVELRVGDCSFRHGRTLDYTCANRTHGRCAGLFPECPFGWR